MIYLRIFLRLIAFVIIIGAYFLATILAWTLLSSKNYRKVAVRLIQICGNLHLLSMNFRVKVSGNIDEIKVPGRLVVANHVTYMDVLVMSSLYPFAYVTSYEIRDTPFLGWLCRLGGCLFVERRSREGLKNEISELTQALKKGISVALYPEATSTDGAEIRKFKRPLFRAAIEAETKVVPVTINYVSASGEPLTRKNHDIVCWYGDAEFLPNLIGLYKQSQIDVEIIVSKPIEMRTGTGVIKDETMLAEESQKAVAENFKPLV